jgi:hypothetical protein
MPSSFEHCSVCPFAAVAAGSEEIEYMEQALVQFYSLNMHKMENNGETVMIVRRGDAEE